MKIKSFLFKPIIIMKEFVLCFENIDEDIVFYVGENANDNFNVIDKGDPTDLWFHVKDYSSCHVVARIPEKLDKRELKTIIKRGALLCKQNTNKLSNASRVEIMYTQLQNVSKTNKAGCVNIASSKTICC